MQNKQIVHSFGGMKQDTTQSKFSNSYYFEGKNIRLTSTTDQATGSVQNEKGNLNLFTIPNIIINAALKKISYLNKVLSYNNSEIDSIVTTGDYQIIGMINTKDNVILFSTNNIGCDCIWKVNKTTYNLTLIYVRNMEFSTTYPLQIINNFENEKIDKLYWLSGIHQIRSINIQHSIVNGDIEELIDIPVKTLDMVGKYNLSQPVLKTISRGGIHTAGMIQYAYNLYRQNSSQTKMSALSTLIPLAETNRGGDVNEKIGAIPVMIINNIDLSYTHIKVYAIKYTSYNEIPSVSLIEDTNIPLSGNMEIFDDGNTISSLSIEEFLFIGANIIIPKHAATKENRLFLANYQERNFKVDIDTRAYSFNSYGASRIYKNLKTITGTIPLYYYPYGNVQGEIPSGDAHVIYPSIAGAFDDPVLYRHDSVNLDYNEFKYQINGTTYGGEGKYLKYELYQSNVTNDNNKYFKDSEIYRIGIVFYNSYAQTSEPYWIADFKAREGNLEGRYNQLKVTLKPEFFTWLNNTDFESDFEIPVSYKILLAERNENDKTIVASGIISPMMINHKTNSDDTLSYNQKVTIGSELPKLPNILLRSIHKISGIGNTFPMKNAEHLREMTVGFENIAGDSELQPAYDTSADRSGRGYQFSPMMQLYSPDITFGTSLPLSAGQQLSIKGVYRNTNNSVWGRRFDVGNKDVVTDVKVHGALSSFSPSATSIEVISGQSYEELWVRGLISYPNGNDANRSTSTMCYRELTAFAEGGNKHIKYDIYGAPELTEKGQDFKNYNNDSNYRYTNDLRSILTDGNTGEWDDDGNVNRKITSVNSFNTRCVTFITGSSDKTQSHSVRPRFENFVNTHNLYDDNMVLVGEIVKSDIEIYMGNIYGGNSYSDKLRSNYIEIGNVTKLDPANTTVTIESPGDTFVQNYRFLRVVRHGDSSTAPSQGVYVLEEMININRVETTIDLKNRKDLSNLNWDNRFQPFYEEFHNYNRVYSQTPNLVKYNNLNYNIKKISNFETNITTTKSKLPGELIDSWTDLLTNETSSMDGTYGPITSLNEFNDEIYCFQKNALAFISVSPRTQIQGDDGISVELGSGNILDRYKYISTTSGTSNKWSVIPTPSGLYFYDLENSAISVFNGKVVNLSDLKGLHSFMISNTDNNSLKTDNPLFNSGVNGGFDFINNDLFLTFKQVNKPSFTISFNELLTEFISLHDSIPSLYVNDDSGLLTTSLTNTKLYKNNVGEYNKFFESYHPSYIVLNVNPAANMDTVFDNIMFKSEVYLNDIDQPDKTLTNVRLYNEYQDSGLIPLVVGRNSNLRRKFRDWNAILPRNKDSRERIRNPWVKLVLQFDNTSNYKLILHDIIVSYSV